MRDMCALLILHLKKVNFFFRAIQKSGSFLVDAKENAERSWTPPLVCSISRAHFNVTEDESIVVIFWTDEEDDDARFFFLRRATFKREKKKNDYFFFHSWGYAVSRRGDDDHTLPVFVFLRPRKDEKRCDDDNETMLWHELFLLDEK